MNVPLVSVIIPVHNGQAYIQAAIESVLTQDHAPVETIVVDDGSTDSSGHIARRYPQLRYVHQANRGPAAARNAGLALARGAFITFLDHDDIAHPARVETQAGFLQRNDGVDCVLGRMEPIFDEGVERAQWVEPAHGVYAMSAMIRAAVFERVGGFDERHRHGEDWEWLVRIRQAGLRIEILPDVLGWRRVHRSNLSRDGDHTGAWMMERLKEGLDRRRGRGPGPGGTLEPDLGRTGPS
jgi:glycosyltransferase involved in cell wall biosynthesis